VYSKAVCGSIVVRKIHDIIVLMSKRRFEIAAGVSATAVVLGLTLVDAGNQPPKPPNDSAKVQALARYIITHGKAEALPKSVNG
jgi:hypothetical protein